MKILSLAARLLSIFTNRTEQQPTSNSNVVTIELLPRPANFTVRITGIIKDINGDVIAVATMRGAVHKGLTDALKHRLKYYPMQYIGRSIVVEATELKPGKPLKNARFISFAIEKGGRK